MAATLTTIVISAVVAEANLICPGVVRSRRVSALRLSLIGNPPPALQDACDAMSRYSSQPSAGGTGPIYTEKGFVWTSPDIAHLDAFETPAENTASCRSRSLFLAGDDSLSGQ
jgi:hypothetical protein